MYTSITVIMPTLNSEKFLKRALVSIYNQKKVNNVEVIIADGNSTDRTIEIANKFPTKIIKNNLITGEAGKLKAINASSNELLAFIDSDNILNDKYYFKKAINVFNKFRDLDCVEPIGFKYIKNDYKINQYCALMGLNDPIEFYTKRFDKFNVILNDYSTCIKENKYDNIEYLIDKISDRNSLFPTFGANGTILKKNSIKSVLNIKKSLYYFDTDITFKIFNKKKSFTVCKIKSEITHLYCKNIKTFIKKQSRRISDFLHFKYNQKSNKRTSNISKKMIIFSIIKFILIFPILVDSFKLFIKSNYKINPFFHFFFGLSYFIDLPNFYFKIYNEKKNDIFDRKSW